MNAYRQSAPTPRQVAVRLAAVAAALLLALGTRPGLERYEPLRAAPSPAARSPAPAPAGVRVTFLGASTLLFTDGRTSFMTDGFFSRPGLLRVALGRIEPAPARITAALRRANVVSLSAVIPLHTHYDHALDSAVVAQKTGAELVGSPSAAAVGRAHGLPEGRIRRVRDGEVLRYGDFRITVLSSSHVPTPRLYPGPIVSLPAPSARVGDYRMGDCHALLVAHGRQRLLVQGSAGFVEGGLRGREADVVYLSIGQLGKQDAAYRERYWRETVRAVGARRVVAVHWDDFFRPLDEPLAAAPWLIDHGFHTAMEFLLARRREEGVEVVLPVEGLETDPYAGLPAPVRPDDDPAR